MNQFKLYNELKYKYEDCENVSRLTDDEKTKLVDKLVKYGGYDKKDGTIQDDYNARINVLINYPELDNEYDEELLEPYITEWVEQLFTLEEVPENTDFQIEQEMEGQDPKLINKAIEQAYEKRFEIALNILLKEHPDLMNLSVVNKMLK